jgi:hypothetical protein
MATRKVLNPIDFMVMDIHREMTDDEVGAIHPQAVVDKSIGAEQDQRSDAKEVGAPHPQLRLLDPLPDNVELLDVSTSHRLQVQRVLQSSLDYGLDDVMVIGWVDDGPIFFLATDPSIGNAVYRLELAKQRLLAAVPDRWEVEMCTTRDIPDEPA